MTKQPEPCCPKFNIQKRDEKTHHRDKKMFIKESMRTFFHIPRPATISKKISNAWKEIQAQNAYSGKNEDYLILFHDPSAFKSDIFLTTDKKVEGFENVEISGDFESKVFEGPYQDAPKFMKQMEKHLQKQ